MSELPTRKQDWMPSVGQEAQETSARVFTFPRWSLWLNCFMLPGLIYLSDMPLLLRWTWVGLLSFILLYFRLRLVWPCRPSARFEALDFQLNTGYLSLIAVVAVTVLILDVTQRGWHWEYPYANLWPLNTLLWCAVLIAVLTRQRRAARTR